MQELFFSGGLFNIQDSNAVFAVYNCKEKRFLFPDSFRNKFIINYDLPNLWLSMADGNYISYDDSEKLSKIMEEILLSDCEVQYYII